MMTRQANPHRGEISVTLGGVGRVLRPTFTAIARIENDTGRSLQELTARGVACVLSLTEIATILHAGLAHDPDCPDRDTVGQWVIDGGGAVEYYSPCGRFLVYGLTGGRDADDDNDAGDNGAGEWEPGRDTRSGGWRGWLAGLWAGRKINSGGRHRTN
ncbi:MAG: GTA-gp10 family protein [Pseudomonadota bacterium]